MKKLVEKNFQVPELLETDKFRLRMLTVNDLVKDYDAVILMWVRQSEVENGLDEYLFDTVKQWIKDKWLFKNPAYPGRDIDWDTWNSLK